MTATLDQDVIADVISLFLNEGSAVAGAKPKQRVIATDTKRLLIINAAGDGIELGISDDSKQALLAGPQNFTGAKTFDGGAIVNNSFTANALAKVNSIQLSKSKDYTGTSGGATAGAAVDLPLADESRFRVFGNSLTPHYKVAPSAQEGRVLLISNEDSSDEAIFGVSTDFWDNKLLYIAPDSTAVIYSDGNYWYKLYVPPRNGNFIANYTGFAGTETADVNYSISGNIVTVVFRSFAAISNDTVMTIDNVPDFLQTNSGDSYHIVPVYDNTTHKIGMVRIKSGAEWEFYTDVDNSPFTNSGSKGVQKEFSVSYRLN